MVCDGVGGNAKGEVASAESVDLVHSWVKRWRKTLEAYTADPTKDNANLVRRLLESAVQSACYMVFGMGEQDPQQQGHVEHAVARCCVWARWASSPRWVTAGSTWCAGGSVSS